MPPRRPLTDLDLIAVIKQLTPNSQLNAARMSPRCRTLVRAANRRVKLLAITGNDNYEETQKKVNGSFLATKPSMVKLRKVDQYFSDFPMTSTPLSKWNCLGVVVDNEAEIDLPTIELIVNSFSAVTALKLVAFRNNAILKFCVKLLEQPDWTNQLSQLLVGNFNLQPIPTKLGCSLITAINGLSALQYLSGPSFLSSLERLASGNVGLRVYFHLRRSIQSEQAMFNLSPSLRRCIVHYGMNWEAFPYPGNMFPLLCQQFPSLTSLGVKCTDPAQLRPLFTTLSHLQQLVHLSLEINLTGNLTEEELRPLAQLTSVRALDLRLELTFHSQVQWLNLQQTLPHCQSLHLKTFRCTSCDISFYGYIHGVNKANPIRRSKALKCLRDTLSQLHTGVHSEQITLGYCEPYPSLEQIIG
ncbi:hypothetical protein TYRP_006721 [Tyrophagus putrescentiae]|nr:hypothetical protein TYRP_006721 [Tyrophagus putrescentiae]